jgi:hypothetical protein
MTADAWPRLTETLGKEVVNVEFGPGGDSPWVRLTFSDGAELHATEPNYEPSPGEVVGTPNMRREGNRRRRR